MDNASLNWITGYIWGIADDVLRDLYVRGKYRDVILPMTLLRLLQAAGQEVDGRPAVVRPRPTGGDHWRFCAHE